MSSYDKYELYMNFKLIYELNIDFILKRNIIWAQRVSKDNITSTLCAVP